jgi:hypothetical protein
MRHTGETLIGAILTGMADRFEARLCSGGSFLLVFAYCWLSMGTAVDLWAQGQPQPPTPTASSPPTQKTDRDNAQRIEALERDMAIVKYGMELARDVAIAMGGLATVGLVVFGFLSWRRESRVQETYRLERQHFETGQRLERENYVKERKFYEMQAEHRADQESRLSAQQLEMGTLQSKNIEALGHVLDVIARASDIRLKREEGQEEFESMLKSLRTGAERRYLQARDAADRLKDVKAAQWPTLPADRRQVAIGALRAYQSVDDFIKEEKSKKEASRHAVLLQRLGVFAYYADHNYEGAISYLGDAIRFFGEQIVDDQFKPAQAWAQHFLGILKKNWPLRIEAAGTSLRQAQELLAAAEGYLTMDLGQFLTPLTRAEVLSYLPDQQSAADAKTSKIVELLERLCNSKKADNIQMGLLPRAYLLRGNIAHMRRDRPRACNFFAQACDAAETNPYAWLSLAEATADADSAKPHWTKGLSLLARPPAADKPETSTRVLVFSWGILASHSLGDSESLKAYRASFDDIGSLIEREGKYTPLFFSPTTKNLVPFDELSQQLAERLSKRVGGVVA